ncbi:MAG: hypothetical protein AAFR84_20550 [Pseudomonadota bacterium]
MRQHARLRRLEAESRTAARTAFLTIEEGDEAQVDAFKARDGLTDRDQLFVTVYETKPNGDAA